MLAAYTYSSGLRAPALIAFVKDTLIYIVIIVAVIYLPTQLGGWGHIFDAANDSFDGVQHRERRRDRGRRGRAQGDDPAAAAQWAYASLALGSALALFMYPHSVTGVLSTRSRSVIRRNAALLPAYSFLLGLLALLGFVAIAAGREGATEPAAGGAAAVRERVPAVVRRRRASRRSSSARWCRRRSCRSRPRTCGPATSTGPSSSRDATHAQEAQQSKVVSLVVKFGALVFVLALSNQFAINLQLLGGVWILQTLAGDRGRPVHPLVPPMGAARRLGGRAWPTAPGWRTASPLPGDPDPTSAGRWCCFPGTETTKVYIALLAFLANLVVAVVLTVVFRAMKVDEGVDQTSRTTTRPTSATRASSPSWTPIEEAHA